MPAGGPRRRSAASTGRRPSAAIRSTTRASAPSQPTASTVAVTAARYRPDEPDIGPSPEAELLVARRSVLERFPGERAARTTDPHLEPGHDERPRRPPLVP